MGAAGIITFNCSRIGAALLMVVCGGTAASADIVISSKATTNMSCADGTCEPTAPKAVLNAGDLQNYIAQFGNMTVQTTGNGVEAHNLVVTAGFASPASTTLNLLALGAIRIDEHVAIGSSSELELVSETGGELGTLSFGPRGHVSFGGGSNVFGINGGIFTLVDSLPALAAAIASADGAGFYALTDTYDADKDGTYHSSPIGTTFTGYFEALGNAIGHLSIRDKGEGAYIGLFSGVDGGGGFGVVRNLKLDDVAIKAGRLEEVGGIAGYFSDGALLVNSSATGTIEAGESSATGGLVGELEGVIESSSSAVRVIGGSEYAAVGGLVGDAAGTIANSSASGSVTGGAADFVGGLIGESAAAVSTSFATGAVRVADMSYVGGFIGVNIGSVANCYATGTVNDKGGDGSAVGGLIGYATTGASDSYAAGAAKGRGSDLIGGVVGSDNSDGGFTDAYWNTSTGGASQGAGNLANDAGIAGLNGKQLRSGLPDGFEKSVWRERSDINSGFPYLIANPPPH